MQSSMLEPETAGELRTILHKTCVIVVGDRQIPMGKRGHRSAKGIQIK